MQGTDGRWLGSGTMTPDGPVIAGSSGSWAIRYTTGVAGIDVYNYGLMPERIFRALGEALGN